jgi:predicted methyltransferase/DNA-directed RNA polymerase subunit RPC12/RpoP
MTGIAPRHIDHIGEEVAAAVGLAEGAAGVRDVLATVAAREPISVRDLSRWVEIPVPVVTAVCGELRRSGLMDTQRPVRLTAQGRAAVARDTWVRAGRCDTCDGRGTVLPRELLGDVADRLTELAAGAPRARLELDQTHCTADTKLRRVLFLAGRGLLARPVLLLGDDDLTSLAVALVAHLTGTTVPQLAVVDVDLRVLDYIGLHAQNLGVEVTLVHHDLTSPLPGSLRSRFDVAVTDPPYTTAGAALFLSRAVSALRPGVGRDVVLAFGARGPDDTVRLQRLFARMELAVRSLTPNFNEYLGAGVLGGTSHLYHLRTTETSRPSIAGCHRGTLYTASERPQRTRRYACVECRAHVEVGPGQRYRHLAELRQAGCPRCAARRFRPLSLRAEGVRP